MSLLGDMALAIKQKLNLKLDITAYTASDVLAKIKTVDGSGSGLDADLLKGLSSTNLNTINTVVVRDGTGNFSANIITASLTGNSSTATKLQTIRTINGVSFDGTANITIADDTKLPLTGGTLTGALTGVSFNGITGFSATAPTIDGVAAVGVSTLVSRGDHVHPAQTTITGNAGTATTLQTGRTIAITGDLIYTSPVFNGSANITAVGTLASSGVTAGTYNNSVTSITPLIVDSKGRITGTGAAVTITPAWSSITSKPTTVAGYGISDVYTTTNTYSKSEVDSLVQGFRGKASATVATTAALIFNTAQTTIDGVTISITDRVLIKNQANAAQNGIYTNVTTTAWIRAENADTAEELTSALVFVDKGTLNRDTAWLQTTDDIVLETSSLNWIQFANSGSYAPLVHTHSATDITSGILPVARGGTGVSTITGLIKGNGTGAMTAAIAGTDYVLPSGSITGNAATATKLAVVRTINGTNFDGTTDITITDDTKQPIDGDLTSIAGLAGTTGLLRKNAANSWSLDTTAYLSNIGITLPLTSTGGANPTLGINVVTTSANGIMIASDKVKLDTIAANANNYSLPNSTSLVVGGVKLFSDTVQAVVSNAVTATASRTYGVQANSSGQLVVNVPWVDTTSTYVHPTTDGSLHVPATGTTNNGKVLMAGATAGSASWQTIPVGVVDHTLLSNIGTNTHAQIDTALIRLANTSGTNTGDQTITLTGDVTGTGTGSFVATLSNSGVTAGTYSKVIVDAKGRITAGMVQTMEDIPDATFKRSVKAATTANITLSSTQVVDGVTLLVGDRVLVKDHATPSGNGIYVVAAGAWTRALDADTSSKIASAIVAVDAGTVNGGKLFDNDFKTTDTLGTTAMIWNMNLDDGALLAAGSASIGTIKYSGITAVNGQFDGGTTTPTGSVRLNYGGYFYPTALNLVGQGDTTNASTHVFVETGSDGFIRPKTIANFKAEMFTTPVVSGKMTNNYLSLNRAASIASGIEWYNSTYNAWVDYMGEAGVAGQGPKGTITPTVGTLVTTWGRRSFIENAAGLGWTFESGLNSATSPNIVAEIRSSDGAARFGGNVTAPTFTGALTGNAATATKLAAVRTINGYSFDGTADIGIDYRITDFNAQANNIVTGGGTISVSATWEVKWSLRFTIIGNGRGALTATAGYFYIDMPAVSTVITGVGGATNKTVTANGIPLGAWETLYYILPIGASFATENANFRVGSNLSNIDIPSNWIKICSKNDDGGYVDFVNGASLRNNRSINTNLYDVKGEDVDGAVAMSTVFGSNSAPITMPIDNLAVNPGVVRYDTYNSNSVGAIGAVNNANGLLSLGQHTGGYLAQLSFSSDNRLYYRNEIAGAPVATWNKIAFENDITALVNKIKYFIANPDSTCGILTMPKAITESVTIPVGRVAIMPDVTVEAGGDLEILGDVFIPSGSSFQDVDSQIASLQSELLAIKSMMNPAGTIIASASQLTPSGHLKANGDLVSRATYNNLFAAIGTTYGTGDGSTTFALPDLRGQFIRGFDDGKGLDIVNIASWSYSGTTITINTTGNHGVTVGQKVTISGLVSTTNAPNGDRTVLTIATATSFTFTAMATPTGTATVSSAKVSRTFGSLQTDGYLNHSHTGSTDSQGAHTHTVSGTSTTNTYIGVGDPTNLAVSTSVTTSSAGAHTHTVTVAASTTGTTETRPKNIALMYYIKY